MAADPRAELEAARAREAALLTARADTQTGEELAVHVIRLVRRQVWAEAATLIESYEGSGASLAQVAGALRRRAEE